MTSGLTFDGVLFFPLTPFDRAGAVDLAMLDEHVSRGLQHAPGAIFPSCGTGEFHALAEDEALAVAARTVQVTAGRVPVLAGIGGALPQAIRLAERYEDAGVDGLLLLPPYLVSGPRAGLEAYVDAVASATRLPIVLYHRGTARYDAATVVRLLQRHPTIVGFKDGVGDVALAQDIVAAAATVRDELHLFNGLLTAEASQGAYRGIGIPLYSSSTFAMAPEVAGGYYRAYTDGDEATRLEYIRKFYAPLVHLRDTVAGYGVSLIKAGARLSGLPVGGVRAPLIDPTPEHEAELAALLSVGRELASA